MDAYLDVDRFKVVSFGTLPSAIALAEKFTLKADGGDDSLALRLREHIVLVEAMRDAYIAAGQLIDQQDEAFVSRLSSYTASLDH
ncbi:hypothetical protein DW322_16495 [Rhodococcus rhodnii]|uniref:Uncharacterized protein n=1 Tax=Rhodococcus rhodnii TaxID=38312 RepID=A0A6P2CFG1_9NOCA|nr:hypothetical protein DW322_16495 [Rhodococcus rhodnii]